MELKELKKLLKAVNQSDLFLFRHRRINRDGDVFCLEPSMNNYWILSYMERGKVQLEIYFMTRSDAYLYIRNDALKSYIQDHRNYEKELFTDQLKAIDLEKKELLKRYEKEGIDIFKNKKIWWPDQLGSYNVFLKKENQQRFCIKNFLLRIDQLDYFCIDIGFCKDEQMGYVFDPLANLYQTVYYDRGQYLWGKRFISYPDVALFMCRQAFTVFTTKQKLLIAQWQKELQDGKSWIDLHFREKRKEKPEGYRPFSKVQLTRFLGLVKYRINYYEWVQPGEKSEFGYNSDTYNNVVTIKGQEKNFYKESSAQKFLFKKEYEKKLTELSKQYGSKKGAWLHIYESEFNAFVDRYENYFREEDKRFTNDYFEKSIWNVELRKMLWHPNEPNEVIKDASCCDNSDFKPTWIERYGNLYGSHVSDYGTPFQMLSLPPALQSAEYHVLQIMVAIETRSYTVAPAFGQPGGATVYVLPEPISELMRKGVLKLIR